MTSSIAIGDYAGFDLDDDLKLRSCSEDQDYPLALEGETVDGHSVSISISKTDMYNLFLFLNNLYK